MKNLFYKLKNTIIPHHNRTWVGERTVQVNDCVRLNTEKGIKLGTIAFISKWY